MPKYRCPYPDCEYETEEAEGQLAAVLLQIHSSGAHAPAQATIDPPTTSAIAKVERVRRKTITTAGSSEEWTYFQTRWQDYIEATRVTGKDMVVQLLECCDETLRKDLTRNAGGTLTNKPIVEVMAAIRKLAVREENTMVARAKLHNMRQDRDETIRSFGARLRGQASVCKFTTDCPNCAAEINYTDSILRDTLTRGVADSDIQLDLLSDKNQNMTLEEAFQFIEAKEAGKRSAGNLLDNQSVDATRSQYRRGRQQELVQSKQRNKNETCSYCGKQGHGKSAPPKIRRQVCPAYGNTCESCGRPNHHASVCRSRDKPRIGEAKPATNNDEESAVFDNLCETSSHNTYGNAITLDHHVYHDLNDRWVKQPSKAQPYLKINANCHPEDYTALGYKLTCTRPRFAKLDAMADTGCQSCLTSMKVIERLGIRKKGLIPVTMRMHAANNNGITILGAAIVRFSGQSKDGQVLESRQIVYVIRNSNKLFLSRETCTALGIITENFPTIGEALHVDSSSDEPVHDTGKTDQQNRSCDCPRRQLPPPKPEKLPFPATDDNRKKLEDWLLNYYRSSTFNTCEHQQLPLMEGPPMRLMIDKNAEPTAHHTPIPVPLHWQDEVKAGLDQDVALGVIEKVPIGEPVTWCHRMVICAKKNGKPRRTVDFQALNAYATRETHHTQSPFHQARSVPSGKKKSVFDCWNGYHSVPLHPDDRHLTTFITPWGRYRYKSAPQGYIASGDGYSRRFDEIVSDVPNKTKCVDDTLLWADNLTESFYQAVNWLDTCGRHGVTLNPDKFKFGADTVEFAGFEITNNTVRPCQKFLDAIRHFPTPKSITDIRSWFGLINQVAYAFAATQRMLPFRELLKPGATFHWDENLNTLFEKSKTIITTEINEGVRIFDKSRPTCLATDWSKDGIGFWLLQKHCECTSTEPFCCRTGWKISLVGSRFTHAAESRYAPVEGEALAVVDALDKARFFVLGCTDLIIAVDHKPLLKLFGDRSLEKIPNPRLRNLKEKTLRYKFRMTHVPGIRHRAADAVSRHPTGTESPTKLHLPDDMAGIEDPTNPSLMDKPVRSPLSVICCQEPKSRANNNDQIASSASSALTSIATTWDRIRAATASDDNMNQLITLIESGMPDSRYELPQQLQEYHQFRHSLYTVDGVVMYKDRVVIPPSLRNEILLVLHSAHQGISSMTSRAEASVFWPGITPAIAAMRNQCNHCNRMAPSQRSAPPAPAVTPAYPFQCICADYFHYKGMNYLVIVDRYSNWPIIERAKEGSSGLINCLQRVFTTFGIPDECATDGGPEFTAAATRQFFKDWGVHHRLASVAFPHSNCRAEVGVKTVKRIITNNTSSNGSLNTKALQIAILQYRNTPDPETKLSPAQCVFGRPIKDFIPILPTRYHPHPTWGETLAAREEALRNRHMRAAERWSEHTRKLPPLITGNHVRIQNQTGPHPTKWDKTGIVIEVLQHDQYRIKIDGSGRITLRNRKFLRQFTPVQKQPPRHTIDADIRLTAKPTTPENTTTCHPPAPNPHPDTTTDETIPPCGTSTPLINTPTENQTQPPAAATPEPSQPPIIATKTPVKKPPLALRRLLDHNKKGLLEQ